MSLMPLLVLVAASAASNGGANASDACIRASGMENAAVSAPVHFSDRTGLDVLLVTGQYPLRVNKGRAGTMLCLYDRKRKIAQTRDADAWSKRPTP
jgi:hypothetical protein